MSACNACNIWTHVLFDIYGQKHALRTARLLAVLPLIGVHIYTYRPMPLKPDTPKQRLLPRLPRLSLLGRHLLLIVLAKALVLAGLWLVFIKPYKVPMDPHRMEQRMGSGAATLVAPHPTENKDKNHD